MANSENSKYDIIIAGAGAAGLSLAYQLSLSKLSHLKTLIIDKESKSTNDRTWSFWTKDEHIFPNLIFKSWDKILVKTHHEQVVLELSPYRYKMIRGIDFYEFIKSELSKSDSFHIANEKVLDLAEIAGSVHVETNKCSYQANLVFNSLPKEIPAEIRKNKNFLLQHFKGYIIETHQKRFDPHLVRFMDFSVDQNGETRFGYVLPFSEKRALVEFTIFSEELLPQSEYDQLLTQYLAQNLKIEDYEVVEEEFGLIPMTDLVFNKKESSRIYNIGSRGGMTKASTGYTFKQIQDESIRIVKNLEKNYPKVKMTNFRKRFHFYDSVLLHVLAGRLYPADQVFYRLFTKNKPGKILKFLEEKTSFFEDLQVLLSLPSFPFTIGAIRSILNWGTKKNLAKISIERHLKK